MKILAVDPGWGTGWATYETTTGEFESGEVTGFIECCHKLEWLMSDPAVLEVVIENFVITAETVTMTQQTEALRLLGVVENECDKRGYAYSVQAAKDPKKPKAVRVLKVLSWYRKTKDNHANSAAYHLYVYLSGHGLLTQEDKFKLMRSMDV